MKSFTIIFCTLALILVNSVQANEFDVDIDMNELEEYGQNAAASDRSENLKEPILPVCFTIHIPEGGLPPLKKLLRCINTFISIN